jgi:uncharacterized membrane protein YfcA
MKKLLIFALAGFFAQMIDGSLGMGFGATSSSILLTAGITPAIVSATIHFSEIATTAASGVSHYKFKNVDKKMVVKLALPGSIAAFIGAALLSKLDSGLIKPFISIFLLTMGLFILYQFVFRKQHERKLKGGAFSKWQIIPQGIIAGFLDTIGGGGWGPVNTPLFLSRNKIEPRYVIGTVSASEFFITLSASIGFIIFLGWHLIDIGLVIALAVGGAIAAPFAAWIVKILPVYLLAVCVGGIIIFTNINTLLSTFVDDPVVGNIVKIVVIVLCFALAIFTLYQNKQLPFLSPKKQTNKIDQAN